MATFARGIDDGAATTSPRELQDVEDRGTSGGNDLHLMTGGYDKKLAKLLGLLLPVITLSKP